MLQLATQLQRHKAHRGAEEVKRTIWLAGLLGVAAWSAQDRISIYEVKYGCEEELRKIRGVRDVSIAGVGSDLRLVVRVESEEARESVRAKFGDAIGGYKLHILVSRPSASGSSSAGDCRSCVCPCHKAGRTVSAPPTDSARRNPHEACDMYRELLGMPKRADVRNGVLCQQMVGWTNDHKKVRWLIQQGLPHWESREMGTSFTAYTYIKHRRTCPLGERQVVREIEGLTPVGSK